MITPGRAVPDGGYLHSYEISSPARVVHVSGQTPVASDGTLATDFAGQARQVWANVAAALTDHHMAVTDIVKVTTFLSSRSHREANAEIRREVLGEQTPALTVVIADIYDEDWLLEIEVIAARSQLAP